MIRRLLCALRGASLIDAARTVRMVATLAGADRLLARARVEHLRARVERLEAELATARRAIARDNCADREAGNEHHRCGACAFNAQHGAEAEELRRGIENALDGEDHESNIWRNLARLLDRVGARDSLAHLTAADERLAALVESARRHAPTIRRAIRWHEGRDDVAWQVDLLRHVLAVAGESE